MKIYDSQLALNRRRMRIFPAEKGALRPYPSRLISSLGQKSRSEPEGHGLTVYKTLARVAQFLERRSLRLACMSFSGCWAGRPWRRRLATCSLGVAVRSRPSSCRGGLMGRGIWSASGPAPTLMTAPLGVEADDYGEQVRLVYRKKPSRAAASDLDLPRKSARNAAISREQQRAPAANQIWVIITIPKPPRGLARIFFGAKGKRG